MMKTCNPEFVFLCAREGGSPTPSGDALDRFLNALEHFQDSPAHLAALKDRT
jgi:hypothetical protein